jgi:hypothetical protein
MEFARGKVIVVTNARTYAGFRSRGLSPEASRPAAFTQWDQRKTEYAHRPPLAVRAQHLRRAQLRQQENVR